MKIKIKKRSIKLIEQQNNKRPFVRWFKKMKDLKGKAKVLERINRAEEGDFGDYKHIQDLLYELRISYGPGYRIYFSIEDDQIILLVLGGNKTTQKRDISKALKILSEYKESLL